MIELHFADHVAQRRLCELFDRVRKIRNLVRGPDRVGDLRIDQRVDFDDDVVLGDHILTREDVHRLA